MKWLAVLAIGGVVAGIAVGVYLRRCWIAAAKELAEAEIGSPRYRWTEQDDSLRQQTEARRQHAESIKKDARQLETKDDRASKIHIVGGGR